MLNDKERFEILSLKPDDITQKKLVELFAATNKGESKYEPNDRFILDTNHKVHNKSSIETTVGRYIVNMFAFPESYLKKYGYCNNILSGGGLSKEETRMTDMILTGEMKPEEFLVYMRKGE